ncbi:MAG TPA: lysophospholipid acyltransferase family protein [Rhodocyclaceae bacterium]
MLITLIRQFARHLAGRGADLRAALRLARVALHLLWGCATVAGVFPFIGLQLRRRLKQRWSRQLIQVLGVKLQIHGEQPRGMIVANHVSFLDIYAINALAPAGFVSKDDVLGWPVIGWLSRHTETIFLERGSRSAAQRTREHLAAELERGHLVALFPEGTTSDGHGVLPFHAALLQSTIDAGAPLTPVALRYLDKHGNTSQDAAYVGDTSLGQCLWSIARSEGLTVWVQVLPVMTSVDIDRRHLSAHAHRAISHAIQQRNPPHRYVAEHGDTPARAATDIDSATA